MGAITTIGGGLAPVTRNLYPSAQSFGESLGADVPLATTGLTTIMTTQVLTPGVWLVAVSLTVAPTVATNSLVAFAEIVAGTATATFAGAASGDALVPGSGAALSSAEIAFTAIVTVTAAGTLLVLGEGEPGGAAAVAKATTPTGGAAKASGYTAVRVA